MLLLRHLHRRALAQVCSFKTGASFAQNMSSRSERLRDIYKRASNAENRNTLAWSRLQCWKDFHQPEKADKYLEVQGEMQATLDAIDFLKQVEWPVAQDLSLLVPECTHQSCFIEQNPLRLEDAVTIGDILDRKKFGSRDLSLVSAEGLRDITLPVSADLMPNVPSESCTEMRNHLVISKWITSQAKRFPDTAGLDNRDIREVQAAMIRDTASERLHYHPTYGPRTQPGDFRRIAISVRSNPMRIFPYAEEVPPLMEQFISWRGAMHQSGTYHSLVLACHICVYFLHIHPFPDGNGRVGRTIMYDYLMRQGYLPTVMENLDRMEYVKLISDAQDGDPSAFVRASISSQLSMIQEIRRSGD